jgi:uncharacterized protein YdeI (YjbR/CyaY-like superfamily)
MPFPIPTGFPTPAAFRVWLRKNHKTAPELIMHLFKIHAADQGLTYPQALDEALCFGWIDGVRRQLDADSFSVRFTPRRPRSIWSRVNIDRVQRLIQAGRMAKPGLAAFETRTEARTGLYSFERAAVALPPAAVRRFRAKEKAWRYFQAQTPGYRRTSVFWVMSAKRVETRARRLDILIRCSVRGTRIRC